MQGPTDERVANCWVRYYGRLTRAIYQAQTPAGDWYLMRLRINGCNFNKWVKAADIEQWIREPQVVIQEKKADRRQAYGPRYNGEASVADPGAGEGEPAR